jgi:hypothetical protein
MRNVEPAPNAPVSTASIDEVELETVTGGCAVGGCCAGGSCGTTGGGYAYRQGGGGVDPLMLMIAMQMFSNK